MLYSASYDLALQYDEELTRLEEEISLLPEETDSNTGDVPSRSDSVDRDETYLPQLDVTGSLCKSLLYVELLLHG